MAKSQKKSNREAKKPKTAKPKEAPVLSPFAPEQGKAKAGQGAGAKKGR
jgi:hypothetical protein